MKKALITGITGQDGSYLAELLLQKGYNVYGFGRKNSASVSPPLKVLNDIKFCYGDLTEFSSIYNAIQIAQPDEIYNLASQSHPGESWQSSLETGNVTGLGAHRLFEAARQLVPTAKIFQASSSEVYGNALVSPQNEETPTNAVNPYAVAKIYAQQMAQIYRQSHKMFIACGILFNHESPRRNMLFVTQKVTYGAACAKLGIVNSDELNEKGEPIVKDGKLSLGNLEARRDWGYAPDYVEAMYLMLQQELPDNFVIGTGISRSIEDLCQAAFSYVGCNWQKFIRIDERFMRPVETKSPLANPEKALHALNWKHKTGFEEMVGIMVDAHIEKLESRSK